MSPPNTDPWTASGASANDTDPGTPPATSADNSKASVTSGTDPGIGKPMAAPDTVIDAAEPTWEENDASNNTWEEDDGAAKDDEGVEARLRRLGGRAPQFAHFQPDSAGRYAASYAATSKPVKSRAVSRTDPFGVIVAPDTSPPAAPATNGTEPIVGAAGVGAAPLAVAAAVGMGQRAPSPVPAPLPAEVTDLDLATLIERAQAREETPRRAQFTTTVPGRARKRSWFHSRVSHGGLVIVALAMIAIALLVINRDPSSSPARSSTADLATAAPAAASVVRPAATATSLTTSAMATINPPPVPGEVGLPPPAATAPSRTHPWTGTNAPALPAPTKRDVPSTRPVGSSPPTSPQPTAAPPPRSDDTKRIFE